VIDTLLRLTQAAARPLMWLGMAACLLMMLHITADVVARTLLGSPIAGTLEIASGYYMVAVAFVPWAWVASREGHIRVEVFTARLAPRTSRWLDAAATLLATAYVALFTWQTFLRALQSTAMGESWEAPSGFLPIWWSRWLLPLAGGFMAAYLVLQLVAELARLARPPESAGK
jgi:TRAP-type C4-dicarboxylate transport system permease small subunit